jgi:hypothetical protein
MTFTFSGDNSSLAAMSSCRVLAFSESLILMLSNFVPFVLLGTRIFSVAISEKQTESDQMTFQGVAKFALTSFVEFIN